MACGRDPGKTMPPLDRFLSVAGVAMALGTSCLSSPAFAQNPVIPPENAAGAAAASSNQWAFKFTPYAWLTFMNGPQTIKGRTVDVDTNVFEMFRDSQSLVPFMGYFEARYQDRISLFVDVMYANLTAGNSMTRNFSLAPGVGGSIVARTSLSYETLTMQFGGAYEVARAGADRGAEGPGMAGVGQTAFDVLLGGRYWYQKADLTLDLTGTLNVNVDGLEFSGDRTKAFARSGDIHWVDPFVGGRIRHKLAPHQNLSVEADIGGFGVGSRISWQALAAYSYQLGTTGSIAWAGVVGYRALYVDYVQGSGSTRFEMNLLQHGPLLGLSARF